VSEGTRREAEAWTIAAAGEDTNRLFDAPVELPGCDGRPWVVLRPLTAREALRRESLGLREELELGPDGTTRAVRRLYDHAAMIEFEIERCVVEYALPVAAEGGEVRLVRKTDGVGALGGDLLDRLPARLMDWLMRCLDEVNMRRPEDAEVLAEAKKA